MAFGEKPVSLLFAQANLVSLCLCVLSCIQEMSKPAALGLGIFCTMVSMCTDLIYSLGFQSALKTNIQSLLTVLLVPVCIISSLRNLLVEIAVVTIPIV